MALCLSRSISSVLNSSLRKLLPSSNAAVRSYSSLPRFSVLNNPYSCYSWLLHPSQNLYSSEHICIPCWPKSKVINPENATRCVGSTRGWLGLINPKDCSLYLSHPFSKKSIKLPSIQSLPVIKGDSFDPMVFPRVISQFTLASESGYLCQLPPENVSRFIMRQFALSSSDPESEYDDFVLMAISKDLKNSQLVYCRPGKDETWKALVLGVGDYYRVVYSSKDRLFYTLSHDGCITGWDLHVSSGSRQSKSFFYKDLIENATKLKKPEKNIRDQCMSKHYIVVHEFDDCDDLLLVIKHYAKHVAEDGTILHEDPTGTNFPYKTQRFDVYKVDVDGKKLEKLESLGDKVLFLGLNESFSLSESKHIGLKGNSIYFTDDFTEKIYSKEFQYGGHDVGVYSLEDNSITESKSCAFFVGLEKKIEEPMFWLGPSTVMIPDECRF